jgi:hypothetical protein
VHAASHSANPFGYFEIKIYEALAARQTLELPEKFFRAQEFVERDSFWESF